VHEGARAQGFGSKFELMQVVKSEVRPSGNQVEALVADLDYAQHMVGPVEYRGGHQLVNCGGVKLLTLFRGGLDTLEDAGVLYPGEVVVQFSFSGDYGVGRNCLRTGNRDGSRGSELKRTEKLQ
jgi:hypothetical protein